MKAYVLLALLGALGTQRQVRSEAPEVGAPAPPVVAAVLGSEESFDMVANFGKKPTVLVFGSCT